MKIKEVVEVFQEVLFNRNQTDLQLVDTATFSDGEIEYDIGAFSDGDFSSIMVRFSDNPYHIYREFRMADYNDIYSLIYDALSDDTIDDLVTRIMCKTLKEKNLLIS